MKPLEHRIDCSTTADGRVIVCVNGRIVKARWLVVTSSAKSKTTTVTLEVLHEPVRLAGKGRHRRPKSYVWDLHPCQFAGLLPAKLGQPIVFA